MVDRVREKKWQKYFKSPRYVGPLKSATATGQAGGGCGDLVRIYLDIKENTVTQSAFLASGCPAAIAGASACSEMVTGLKLLEAAKIGPNSIAERLVDLPEPRHSCLQLSATALAMALEGYAGTDIALAGNRILVAMSGGVDSSTAAVKLYFDDYDVLGVTLRLHDYGTPSLRACCTPADIDDARSVALQTGFPHLVLDMRSQFKTEVIDRFCQAYLARRTPNPCVECNRNLRFTHLLQKAADLGASKVATGHYVRVIGPDSDGRFELRRARDLSKDQSYMFWGASQSVLSHILAPLGELNKDEVREMAKEYGLSVANKLDSQDVCFVPDGDYAGFVQRETGHCPTPGPITDSNGAVLGEHKGLINYTVGQRKGLGVSAEKPLYVVELDSQNNSLVVGFRPELDKKSFTVSELNLVSGAAGDEPFKAEVMVRYNSDTKKAVVRPTSESTAIIEFSEPFGPIAPGQSAVFYDDDLVLGGGIID